MSSSPIAVPLRSFSASPVFSPTPSPPSSPSPTGTPPTVPSSSRSSGDYGVAVDDLPTDESGSLPSSQSSQCTTSTQSSEGADEEEADEPSALVLLGPFSPAPTKRRPLLRSASFSRRASTASDDDGDLDHHPRASSSGPIRAGPSGPVRVPHPYARLYAQRERDEARGKRRVWSHALESAIFTREEMLMRAAQRRAIYISSLEAHVDELHTQLIDLGLYPIPFAELSQYKGTSSKIVKGVVAGLHADAQFIRSKQAEIERANLNLRNALNTTTPRYDEEIPNLRLSSPRSATLLPSLSAYELTQADCLPQTP